MIIKSKDTRRSHPEVFLGKGVLKNVGGRGVCRGVELKILGKNSSNSFVIREWPKNNPLPSILINLDNFPPNAFYLTPCPPSPPLAPFPTQLGTKEYSCNFFLLQGLHFSFCYAKMAKTPNCRWKSITIGGEPMKI